jgi:hypothetical protein
MHGLGPQDRRNLVILAVVAIAMVFLYGEIRYTIRPYSGWDLANYRAMAQAAPGLTRDIVPPFPYRILGPYVAGLLPLPDPIAFRLLSAAASVSLVVLFYGFLRTAGLTPAVTLISVVLYTFSRYWFGFTSWNYFQLADLLSQIYIVVLFWSMLSSRWWIFGATLVLAALTRETGLLMAPVALIYLWSRGELASRWRTLLLAIVPALLVFLLLRLTVPVGPGQGLSGALAANASKLLSPERLGRLLVTPLLPYTFIPLVFFEITIRFFRARVWALAFVVLVVASTLFGSNDERLMAPVFIVAYWLIGLVLEATGPRPWFVAVLLVAGFASTLHHMIARFPLQDPGLTRLLSLGALGVVTAAAVALRLQQRRQPG